jgi:Tol biopolymer transport system component
VGLSSQEILAAHVTQAPEPVTTRRPAVPPALATIIMTCLAKRPADRWQSADELLEQLEQQLTPSGGVTPTQTRPVAAVAPGRPLPLRAIGIAAAALLLAVAALVWARRPPPPLPALGKRSALTLDPGLEMSPAVSPDGKLVAYSQVSPSESRLVVQQVTGGEPVPVAKLPGAFVSLPAWSPDGSRLLYLTPRGLEVVPALGGVSRLLIPGQVGHLGWGAWAPDGDRVVYTVGDSIYLRQLSEQAPSLIVTAQEPHSPAWSPDGRWVAFVSGNSQYPPLVNIAPSSIWVVASSGGRPIRITEDQPLHASPVWLPDSRGLLFVSDQDGGRDVYLVRLSRAGAPEAAPARLTTGLHPHTISLSADGHRLIYSLHTETANIKRVRLEPNGSVSLTQATPVTSGSPVIEGFTVSPDGKWVLFDSNRNGNQDIWRAPMDGTGPPEPIATSPADEFQPDYSGDGKWIAYHVTRSGAVRDLYVMPADGGTPERVNVPTPNNPGPRLSPDGQALVYNCGGVAVTVAGRVCLTRREGPGTSWSRTTSAVVAPGARFPDWSPDGRWIAFLRGDSLVRSTPEGKDSRVLATIPAGLAASRVRWPESRTIYLDAVARDGRYLVYAAPATGGPLREVVHSDGPTYQSFLFSFAVHANTIYASLADPQSDIWMAELTRP